MGNERKNQRSNSNGEHQSLLVPITLLDSVVDSLKDNFEIGSNSTTIANESEILSIITKIEIKLRKIKGRLGEKDNPHRGAVQQDNFQQPLFPPPPIVRAKHEASELVENRNDIAEEASLSTISSGDKVEIDDGNQGLHPNDDENLTLSNTRNGPLHDDRRQSRRLSHPYITQDANMVRVEISTSLCSVTLFLRFLIFTCSFQGYMIGKVAQILYSTG